MFGARRKLGVLPYLVQSLKLNAAEKLLPFEEAVDICCEEMSPDNVRKVMESSKLCSNTLKKFEAEAFRRGTPIDPRRYIDASRDIIALLLKGMG